jgi:hypothetical protein
MPLTGTPQGCRPPFDISGRSDKLMDLFSRSGSRSHVWKNVGFAAGQHGDRPRHHFVARISSPAKSAPRAHCSCEANVFRPAKLQHAVERGDSNGHLGRLPPFGARAPRVTDHSLVAADIGFHQGTPIVARCPLPAHPAALGDQLQVPVAAWSARSLPLRLAPRSNAAAQ